MSIPVTNTLVSECEVKNVGSDSVCPNLLLWFVEAQRRPYRAYMMECPSGIHQPTGKSVAGTEEARNLCVRQEPSQLRWRGQIRTAVQRRCEKFRIESSFHYSILRMIAARTSSAKPARFSISNTTPSFLAISLTESACGAR